MHKDQTEEGQDPQGVNLHEHARRVAVTVHVPWALHHERPRFRAVVERDAARQFRDPSVDVQMPTAGWTMWRISGLAPADGDVCRRLLTHYQEGFGPRAQVTVREEE